MVLVYGTGRPRAFGLANLPGRCGESVKHRGSRRSPGATKDGAYYVHVEDFTGPLGSSLQTA